ncbi:MAG: DUF5682 family protein [Pseudomarimonas sp.]
MSDALEVIGVRHHSPACARLVEARLRAWRPQHVLIEGPSDFNERMGELQSAEHLAPIAIFSYYAEAGHTRHCFAPFSDYAPEWIALQTARDIGAQVRFIDLPYWHEGSRGRAALVADAVADRRQRRRERALAERLGLDDGDALWDHLFEQSLPQPELAQRLAGYFDELRRDEPGDASDCAREAYMARWIARTLGSGERVLVVCGGWHRAALLQRVNDNVNGDDALELAVPDTIERHGSFLVPYSDRRLEALGGYGAGVQSPAWYRWLYRDGADAAAEQAMRAIVERLRERKQVISTASLIAATTRTQLLARLRGHAQPMRIDVLDGVLDAICSDALSAPPPWQARETLSMRDDPMLRETLLALTGDTVGRLAPGTPLPPLVFDVEATQEKLALTGAQNLQLDRHREDHRQRAQALWRLQILRIPGFQSLGSSAPRAARQLAADQHPLEDWRLTPNDERHVALIEAGAYGPTLQAAALRRLEEQLGEAIDVDALASLYAAALRAGYAGLGASLLSNLHAAIAGCHQHGALARAGLRLLTLAASRLGPDDPRELVAPALDAILLRLLWLLEGLCAPNQPAHADDVEALRLVDRLLTAELPLSVHIDVINETLARLAGNAHLPPAARGACFGVLWRQPQNAASEGRLLQTLRGFASGEPLGDFLYGLFALARSESGRSPELLGVLDEAIAAMSEHEFLLAAPSLRQAFHFFPPRERAEIGLQLARRLGQENRIDGDWLQLPCSIADLERGARLTQAVSHLQQRFGL